MALSRTQLLGLAICASLVTVAGCSCSDSTPGEVLDTGPGIDGGPRLDANSDTGPRIDANADMGPRPDANSDTGPMGDTGIRCGNGIQEMGEQCDDTNRFPDDGCSPDCQLECGDGAVTGMEACDTAITTGTGRCPTTCDDAMACTTDTLTGAACAAACVHTPITATAPGDGCCPPGANATTDNDCAAICGNMIVEAPETCDTGLAGSCPTMCNDMIACTADALTGTACTAACSHTPITMPMAGDGCCPPGATPMTDPDCTGCGDGRVVAPETCDTAIMTGAGRCPTTCDDGMVCTADTLVGAGTCSAACMNAPIAAGPMDGCCPTGASMMTDPDCTGRCGDGIVTPPETCDDRNMMAGDGCSPTCQREPRAFRITTMTVQDPHLFATVFFLTIDVTDRVNGLIATALTTDATMPPDGMVDFSPILYFHPLDQTSMSTTPLDVDFASCTLPLATTTCTASTMPNLSMAHTVTTGMAACLAPVPTTFPGGRGINAPTPACFSSDAAPTLNVSLGGVIVPLRNAQVGAQYVGGSPATSLATGLIMGFLTETDAMAAIIPMSVMTVGGMPISALLRAGDRDTLVIGGVSTRGWWFYLNFVASPVTYTP